MAYLSKAFNDILFLKINHLIWSAPCFVLAVWMLTDIKKLIGQPSQIVGVILLLVIGGICIKKGLSNNIQSLKKSRAAPITDIFLLIFAVLSFLPAVIIWELIKYMNKSKKF
jgi:putative Mn2+ efflux pump MntP